MSNANAVIAAAASQIGYFVKPGGVTKFGSWYGLPTGQWCAMFVSWAADQAGATSIIPKHAYTPSGVAWFKAKGQWHNGLGGVRRGDIVYFDFPGLPNRVSHVGIVESVNGDGSVNTIEGNTSGPGGDQRNGGACIRKTRKASIVGYGRPAYSDAPAAPAKPASGRSVAVSKATQAAVRATGDGFWGDDTDKRVTAVRNASRHHGSTFTFGKVYLQSVIGTNPDGVWGPKSAAAHDRAVAALQRAWGINPDGIWGQQTENAWSAARGANYKTW